MVLIELRLWLRLSLTDDMSDDFVASTTPDRLTDVTRTPATPNTLRITGEDEPECRICRESTGPLMSATCRCNTVVHATCLRRWHGYRADALFPLLSSTARNLCEICRHPVNLSKSHNTQDVTSSSSTSTSASASNTLTSSLLAKCESCCLLPRALSTYAYRVCEDILTLESCLFIFLFVLAVMGHALFVLSVYKGAEKDEHSLKRVCLAGANAIVTLSLLILVQKLASRWLREMDSFSSSSSSANNGGGGETIVTVPRTELHTTGMERRPDLDDDQQSVVGSLPGGSVNRSEYTGLAAADIEAQVREYRAYTTRCTTFSQVLLGAFLSVIAAAEIFFLVRELPLGGLA